MNYHFTFIFIPNEKVQSMYSEIFHKIVNKIKYYNNRHIK